MHVFTEFYLGNTELPTHLYYYLQYKHTRANRILYVWKRKYPQCCYGKNYLNWEKIVNIF